MWEALSTREVITLPSVNKDWLILPVEQSKKGNFAQYYQSNMHTSFTSSFVHSS
jgi:hypothetical protein